jgi:uncharacterized protein
MLIAVPKQWMRRAVLVLAAVAALAAAIFAVRVILLRPQAGRDGQPTLSTARITVGGSTIIAEFATTPREQERGLSGRPGLADGTGMLFILDPPKTVGAWMKDMRFPLDIIYAKADGSIVAIYPDLAPATYPKSFYSTAPVRYMLEVPAGFSVSHNIAVGDRILVQN